MAYDTSNEKIAHINNVDIIYETFGDKTNPAILLIQGAGNSMISWGKQFCEQLANGGRFVIRYDSRDAGRSTSYEVGNPPYTLRDLVSDAVTLLDTLGIDKAHIVGLSQGSAIAALIGIEHPEKARSLTLISGTPGGPGHDTPDLPPMTEEITKIFDGEAGPAEPDWNDKESIARYLVEGERPFAGDGIFEEEFFLTTSRDVAERTKNLPAQLTNPFLLDAGSPWRDQLGKITAPTLVVHGTTDPAFPLAHGEALAREIKDAILLPIEDMGHAHITPRVWPVLVNTILEHTR